MKSPVTLFLTLGLSSIAIAGSEPNFSGKDHSNLKSLSQTEIDGYLSGKGMGLAKPAELNRFPGPKHVIEFANELALSTDQRKQTQKIYSAMKNRASEYGRLFVLNEEKIEQLFSENTVTPALLEKALRNSEEIRSKLRGVHLAAHIEQKALLSEQQVRLYDNLRGHTGSHSMQEKNHHH